MEYGFIPEIRKAKQGTEREHKFSQRFPSEVHVRCVMCKRGPHSAEKWLSESGQSPKKITQAALRTLLQRVTPAWQGDSLSNRFEKVVGEEVSNTLLELFSLVKTYLWLEDKPSNLTLQRSEQVRVPPADAIFSPRTWLEFMISGGKASDLLTEFYLVLLQQDWRRGDFLALKGPFPLPLAGT